MLRASHVLKGVEGWKGALAWILVASASTAFAQTCPINWSTIWNTGIDGSVRGLIRIDLDGEGPGPTELIIGGTFARGVRRLAGTTWSEFGQGLDGAVLSAVMFDEDGSGPNNPVLIVGGQFTHSGAASVPHLARWDGSTWTAVGGGASGDVQALAVFDEDGDGPLPPSLLIGGLFLNAGGFSYLARWDGSQWTSVGGGVNNSVMSMTLFDPDEDGPETPTLYAGGDFTTAGGAGINRIARWNGSQWQAIGSASGANVIVRCLRVLDPDGPGPVQARLYASGDFTSIGGTSANRIAYWNGASWNSMGSGINYNGGQVRTVEAFDEDGDGPGGPTIFVAGFFGTPYQNVARWNGTAWTSVNSGGINTAVNVLTTFEDGTPGPAHARLYAGGPFTAIGGGGAAEIHTIAAWDGMAWECFGAGNHGSSNHIYKLAEIPSSENPGATEVYAGGYTIVAEGANTTGVARWNGVSWSALGSGTNSAGAVACAWYDDDGPGPHSPALYVGGFFTTAGGQSCGRMAKWGGQSWECVGGGTNGTVRALAVYDPDDDAGPELPRLYVGGEFTLAGATPVVDIAAWDGSSWSALPGVQVATVYCMKVFDPDGDGPEPRALYVGVGVSGPSGIARWDGQVLSSLVSASQVVRALEVFDRDGSGPEYPKLFAAGNFGSIGGVTANHIAQFDGNSWSSLTGGGTNNNIDDVKAFDPDGAGPQPARLYVSGVFGSAGGVAAGQIAAWDGTGWSAPAGAVGFSGECGTLAVIDRDGPGPIPPELMCGGTFNQVAGITSLHIASIIGCPPLGDLNCDGMRDGLDVSAFVLSLADPAGYADSYPSCSNALADINADGAVNEDDVPAFANSLVSY